MKHWSVAGWLGTAIGAAIGVVAAYLLVEHAPPMMASMAVTGALIGALVESRKITATQDQGLQALIDHLQRRNDEVEEVNHRLERSLVAQKEHATLKADFVQDVNHELRTPLTLILHSLESLTGLEDLSPRAREHFLAMNRSATRLIKLIDHLLDFSRLNVNKDRLNCQTLDLDSFLKALVVSFTAFAREKGIAISVEASSETQIVADPDLLDRVFQNLLANAVKFTESGRISLRASKVGGTVRVDVSDTGIGIAPEDLGKVFERSPWSVGQTGREIDGVRLGMGMTRQIVELLSGKIEVDSAPGKGTTFSVTLPRSGTPVVEQSQERHPAPRYERAAAEAVVAAHVEANARSDGDGALRPHTGDKIRLPPPSKPEHHLRTVLLVEDEAELRSYIVKLLRPRYRVIEAGDGEDGLQKAREERPDLILSDVMMPKLSGTQLTQALRATPETADVPIILLTALRGQGDKLFGLQVGANDYVLKPFSPSELMARIETQLRLRDTAAILATNERLATMGLLSSGFAHEVRNPLNAVLNVLAPIRDALGGPVPDLETAGSLIDLVEECGQRVRHLSETLLAFARPGTRRDVVDVRTGIETTLRVLSWKTSRNLSVNREYESEGWVMGDAAALNQVWLNLLDNAMRAMEDKGSLTVRTEIRGEELCVSVIDSGAGIKPEDLKRLFQPFFSTRPAGEGTGLGLALCRRIVAAHGGHIEIKTELGVGTHFIVHLPLPESTMAEQASA